jgi:tetratricopeptide (TPR) repeat protein
MEVLGLSKFFLFGFLWWILGSPLLAAIVLLLILYFIDRRYIGLFPSLTKPFRRNRRLSKLLQELRMQPHYTSAKLDAARIYIEKKKYAEAMKYLNEVKPIMEDSADVLYELGLCHLKLGDLQQGEALCLQALALNPRAKYGEPYLRLGEAFLKADTEKALAYLEQFKDIQSSSCEAYVKLAQIYQSIGRQQDAKNAYQEAVLIYKSLPKYKRKVERRWALIAALKK